MPRRRPGALRAPHPKLYALHQPYRIDRLSPRTSATVRRAERETDTEDVWPGATETALYWCRRFLARPGRYLEISYAARRELEALLAVLDAELWRRTLPDPFAFRDPWRRGGGWWHHRLRGDRPFG
jgi:hypothetical protein